MTAVTKKKPSPEELEKLRVSSWPIWEKEESEFDWVYDEEETFYVLEGEVEVTLEDGTKMHIEPGDLVTFAQGVRCRWKVLKPIRKHYRLGS